MKYRITLSQNVIETTEVDVEADSQEDAEEKALAIAKGDDAPLTWRFCEIADEMEVILAEEIEAFGNEGAMEAEAERREP